MPDGQDEQKSKADEAGLDMNAIAQAVSSDHDTEVALNRVAEAVGHEPAASEQPALAPPPAVKRLSATKAAKRKASRDKAVASPAQQTRSTSKEETMADASNNNFDNTGNTQTDAANDFTGKAQAFFARSNTMVGELADLGRGNVEAVVESSRILATGLQDFGRTTLEESRAAYEGLTDDVKRMAAVKSPTELMQLQSELARRNLDAVITQTSKNTEAMLKLANDVFAPLSSRMSVTAEKLANAA